jgi:hypothetical protein
MTLVRIIKNWRWPDLMRQTPGRKGLWGGIQFTLDPIQRCDYAVVLNRVPEDTTVECPPENVWAIMQEPPNEHFKPVHRGAVSYKRVYTSDVDLRGRRYVHSHPALPWHVNRDYDYLTNCSVPTKQRSLSWITSNIAVFEGHRARLRFLESIRGQVPFDLFGRGFAEIQDKWDGLAPYHYSLVVENFENAYYWSEKIADCFLAWTMPIYHGCSDISRYFPAEGLVRIDIEDPVTVDRIRDVVSSDSWCRNLDAIAHARELVLDRYQLFPFVAGQIRQYEESRPSQIATPRVILVSDQPRWPDPLHVRTRHLLARCVRKPIRWIAMSVRNLLGSALCLF